MRVRIAIAICLVAVAAGVIALTWLGGADWRKLLLFAGIVCVAAWGRGREVPSEHAAPEATVTDAVPVGEEHPAP
jgi:hypothetical protein